MPDTDIERFTNRLILAACAMICTAVATLGSFFVAGWFLIVAAAFAAICGGACLSMRRFTTGWLQHAVIGGAFLCALMIVILIMYFVADVPS